MDKKYRLLVTINILNICANVLFVTLLSLAPGYSGLGVLFYGLPIVAIIGIVTGLINATKFSLAKVAPMNVKVPYVLSTAILFFWLGAAIILSVSSSTY